jgi:hypothetical protein
MPHSNPLVARPSRRSFARMAFYATGTLAAVTLLLLASNAAAASSPITVLPPYKGSVCASANLGQRTTWDRTTGAYEWLARTTALGGANCTGTAAGYVMQSAAAGSGLDLTVPIGTVPTNGSYNVVANWSLTVTFSVSLSHGSCPKVVLVHGSGSQRCSESVGASAGVSNGYAYLVDLSTGRSTYARLDLNFANSSSWTRDDACSTTGGSMSCTRTTSDPGLSNGLHNFTLGSKVYWNSSSLVAGHAYALDFSLVASVSASFESYPTPMTGKVADSLNMATRGDGFFLTSVTL